MVKKKVTISSHLKIMNFLLKNTANAEKSTDFNNTAYGLSNFIFPYSL